MISFKKINLIKSIIDRNFKLIKANNNVDFIFWEDSHINDCNDIYEDITDKVLFESQENHIHIFDNIKKYQYHDMCNVAPLICNYVSYKLKFYYPENKFVVYTTITIHDSMILRFHQKRENESDYYESEYIGANESIFKVEI